MFKGIQTNVGYSSNIPDQSCRPSLCQYTVLDLTALPNYINLPISVLCQLIWDASIPSFWWICSYRLQIIIWEVDLGTPMSTLDLAVISAKFSCKWQWVYINDLWLFDSISFWNQNIYSHLLVCTQVPCIPSSLSVGLLASVDGIYQWSIIRWCLIILDISSFIHII